MKSVHKGLRSDELEKDTYGRLVCTTCGEDLATENDPDELGVIHNCPSCGNAWREL